MFTKLTKLGLLWSIAQLVERLPVKQRVVGSSPTIPVILERRLSMYTEDQTELVLDFIRLGMGFTEACLAAGLSEEDEFELEDDLLFQRKVDVQKAIAEHDLLVRHNNATRIAEKRGNGQNAIQWRLEKLNPSRYSNKDTDDGGKANGRVTINIIRGKKEE